MKYILAQIIKKKLPEWNEKIFGEDDLYELSKRFKVLIIENAIAKSKGEYLVIDNMPTILLKPNLKKEKLWIGMHEIGHHLLHYPVNHKFSRSTTNKMDRQANFFAAIALITTKTVESKTLGEIMEEYNYPKELILIRKEIYEECKI